MSNEVILAGVNAGVRVFSSPAVAGSWRELKKQEGNRNYWASIIGEKMRQLTAGRISNDSAYVKNVPSNQNRKRILFAAANIPGLKDYSSPGKMMLKKMGF